MRDRKGRERASARAPIQTRGWYPCRQCVWVCTRIFTSKYMYVYVSLLSMFATMPAARQREKERASECVCVCEREREREREWTRPPPPLQGQGRGPHVPAARQRGVHAGTFISDP